MRYASNQTIAHELWDIYGKDLLAEGQGDARYKDWYYGHFENGEPISREARRLYQARLDLQNAFPDPYSIIDPCFLSWWKAEIAQGNITSATNINIKSETLAGRITHGIRSPSIGLRIIKSALKVFRQEGLAGLIHRMRNYS